MNMLTTPMHFENIEAMNKWLINFESKAIAICNKYNDPSLWHRVKIYKDDSTFEVAIMSMGVCSLGSSTEKAMNEILKTFNSN